MNIKQKQTIINSIMQGEVEKYNLDINCYSCCKIKYHNSNFFKKLFSDKKTSTIVKFKKTLRYLKSSAFFHNNNESNEKTIMVFLDNFLTQKSITQLMKNTYHELYHAMQDNELNKNQKNITFDLFASKCDMLICSTQSGNSLKYYFSQQFHDSQMFEILANIHGVKKTLEHLQNNQEFEVSASEIEKLKQLLNTHENQYKKYDLTKRLDYIIINYEKLKSNENFDNTIFKLFINEDGTIKNINEIFSNTETLALDPRILISFLRTNAIKNNISQNSMTDETSYIISELLTTGTIPTLSNSTNTKTM